MIQTLHPYTTTAKTAEIMARYRPIAPKPESNSGSSSSGNDNNPLPQNIRKSAYLRNVWPHLQARPTRTRKRGRTAFAVPACSASSSIKRARTSALQVHHHPHQVQGIISPASFQVTTSPAKTLALQAFTHHVPNGSNNSGMMSQLSVISNPNLVPLKCGLDTPVTTPSSLVTLPLLPCTTSLPAVVATISSPAKSSEITRNSSASDSGSDSQGKMVIDLNKVADVPEELDFMQQLQGPPPPPSSPGVITPRAVRPVGSTIVIGGINHHEDSAAVGHNEEALTIKKPEDVEKEVESQDFPVVVSDSHNKVRLENSAYKELVGQPECCWLDYMPVPNSSWSCGDKSSSRIQGGGGGVSGGGVRKRIGGEVVLKFMEEPIRGNSLPVINSSRNGFTCNVKIEWDSDGKKNSVGAFCEAKKLACNKDYVFEWRFHLKQASDQSSSGSV